MWGRASPVPAGRTLPCVPEGSQPGVPPPCPVPGGGREGLRTPPYRDGQQGDTGSAPQVPASLGAVPPRGCGILLWFVPTVWGASEVWRGWRRPVPPPWAAGALAPRGHHNDPGKVLSGSVGLFTPIRAGAHRGVPVAGAVQRLCGRGPRSRSPHCLGAARPLRWHRARPRGLCLRWGHAGAPAGSVRGGLPPRPRSGRVGRGVASSSATP